MTLSRLFPRESLLAGLLLATLLPPTAPAAETEHSASDLPNPRPGLARATGRNRPVAPHPGDPINDLSLKRYLEIEGARLVESGRTLTNWFDLLGPKTCSLSLPKPRSKRLAPTILAKRVEAATAVVGIGYRCEKCTKLHFGADSGFFATESGALVTSLHVLIATRTNGLGVVVLTRDGRLVPVRGILAADPLHDLVVLDAVGTGFPALPLARRDAETGAPILVVSHPAGHFYAISTGVVARRGEMDRPDGRFRFLSVTADFAKGSSGAPVCDETGAVVGIVNNTQSIYYNAEHDTPQNFQMTVKNCSPALDLLRCLQQIPP
jgi:S1-C subfamily serine protease